MWNFLQSKWQSLVFRLLFYFLISMLLIALILGASFTQRLKPHVQNEILPNLARYIEYLIDDIGHPPDIAVARQLARQLPFEIRIEGQGVNWASSPQLKAITNYEFEAAPGPYKDVYFSHHRRSQHLLIIKDGYQYLFTVDNSFRRGSERRHWVLFGLFGLVLLLLYFLIRRMFKPIEAISEQVRKIGEGNLEQAVEAGGKGEIALLATGINRMSEQIREMLEGKSSLLLAISHELRSPITRMRVNLELLNESNIQQKLIDDVREMETLISSILESEKLSGSHVPLTRSRCEVQKLVEDVVRGHPCLDRIKTGLSPVEASVDQVRLKLLIKNLIDNACSYSSDDQAWIEVSLQKDRDSVIIEVRDHGVGINPEDIPRLTEAFYRPDTSRQRETGGYGLGLYLCQLIARAHGGEIVIESEPGKGTRVIVSLPLDNS